MQGGYGILPLHTNVYSPRIKIASEETHSHYTPYTKLG